MYLSYIMNVKIVKLDRYKIRFPSANSFGATNKLTVYYKMETTLFLTYHFGRLFTIPLQYKLLVDYK